MLLGPELAVMAVDSPASCVVKVLKGAVVSEGDKALPRIEQVGSCRGGRQHGRQG